MFSVVFILQSDEVFHHFALQAAACVKVRCFTEPKAFYSLGIILILFTISYLFPLAFIKSCFPPCFHLRIIQKHWKDITLTETSRTADNWKAMFLSRWWSRRTHTISHGNPAANWKRDGLHGLHYRKYPEESNRLLIFSIFYSKFPAKLSCW